MKPDYNLTIYDKRDESRCNNAGAGWIQDNGSISIMLNPGIMLTRNKNLYITLFKTEKDKEVLNPPTINYDDDIPF